MYQWVLWGVLLFGTAAFPIQLRPLHELRQAAHRVAISPDGTLLAVSEGEKVSLLQLPSGEIVRQLPAQGSNVRQLLFSPDGKYLACASAYGGFHGTENLRLYEVESGKLKHELGEWWNFDVEMGITFSRDSKKLAWTKGSLLIQLEIEKGDRARKLLPFISSAISYNHDGTFLYAAGRSTLYKISSESGQVESKFGHEFVRDGGQIVDTLGHRESIRTLAVSPDGKWLATSDGSFHNRHSRIIMWDLESEKLRFSLIPDKPDFSMQMMFSPSGQGLIVEEGKTISAYQLDFEKNVGTSLAVQLEWETDHASLSLATQSGTMAIARGSHPVAKDMVIVYRIPRELNRVAPKQFEIEESHGVVYWKNTDGKEFALPLTPMIFPKAEKTLHDLGFRVADPKTTQEALTTLELRADGALWNPEFQQQLNGMNFWVEHPPGETYPEMKWVFKYPTILPENWSWSHALARCQPDICLGNRILGWRKR